MENIPPKLSILELFQPLGERLYNLENPNGIVFEDHIKGIMDNISKKVDAYEGRDVIIRCKSYLERIDKLRKNLKVTDYYYSTFFDHEFLEEEVTVEVKRSQEQMDIVLRLTREGLDYCSDQLLKIIENQKSSSNMPDHKTITEIKLPENFTVKQLSAHFEPLLSLRQATLFLYYLREKGVIPNYNASELGRLGEVFFARNNKNVREELTDIHENKQNSGDLKAIQQILKLILEEISSDLKKAN